MQMFNSTINFFKRIGQVKHKYRLEITIDKLMMNPRIQQQLNIVVKRGQHKKQTKKRKLVKNIADYQKQKLIFQTVTMFYDNQTKKYSEKQAEIRVVIVLSSGDKKLAGLIKLDLANYANVGTVVTKKQQNQLAKCPSNFKSSLKYSIFFKYLNQSYSQGGSQSGINQPKKKFQEKNKTQKVVINKVYKKQDLQLDDDDQNDNKFTNQQEQKQRSQIVLENKQKKIKKSFDTEYIQSEIKSTPKNLNAKSNSDKKIEMQNFDTERNKQKNFEQDDQIINQQNHKQKSRQKNKYGKKDQYAREYYEQEIKKLKQQTNDLKEQKQVLNVKLTNLTQKLREKDKQLTSNLQIKNKKSNSSSNLIQKCQNEIQQLKNKMIQTQKYYSEQLIKFEQMKIKEKIYLQQIENLQKNFKDCKSQLQSTLKQKRIKQKNSSNATQIDQYINQIQFLKKKLNQSQKSRGEQLIKFQQLKNNEKHYLERIQNIQRVYTQQLKSIKNQFNECKQQLEQLQKQKKQFQKQTGKKKQLQIQLKKAQDQLTNVKLKISNAMNAAAQQGNEKLIAFLQKKFI